LAYSKHRTNNELRKQGVFVSSSGVLFIWLRITLRTLKARKTLEAKVAEEGIILNAAQFTTLEMKH